MKKFLVKFDESNIGIAWSKGEIIEANSEEEAISKAINRMAQLHLEFDDITKGTIFYVEKSLDEYEKDLRSYTWKATQEE